MNTPNTSESLLIRVRDARDEQAWYQFTEVYRPVIVRLARGKGMQGADAEDLAQQVLVSVAGAINRWEPDAKRAKFRTWLRRVTENAILNALTRGSCDLVPGDSIVRSLAEQARSDDSLDSQQLQLERRREIFRWAAAQVQEEFQADTWQAFWLTAVENQDVDEVAATLHKSRGSIYTARSRVMRQLQLKVQEFEAEE